MDARQEKIDSRYNATAKDLPPVSVGSRVRIQNPTSKLWDRVRNVSIGRSRDYRVKLTSGRILWRNRRHFRPVLELEQPKTATNDRKPKQEDPIPQTRASSRIRSKPVCFP